MADFPYDFPVDFPSVTDYFKLNVNFIGVNREATELYIKDSSDYSIVNIEDIDKFIFTISSFTDYQVYTYDGEPVNSIVFGGNVTLTPQKLGAEDGYVFEDGVYDINEYLVTKNLLSITTASAGNKFVTLSTPITQEQFTQYNVLVDNNNNIYNINKSAPFNADRIDTVEQLKSGITSLAFGYRANVKAEVTVSMDYDLGTLATEECGCHEEERLIKLYFHKAMAQIAMDNQDYKRANTLISGTFNRNCC